MKQLLLALLLCAMTVGARAQQVAPVASSAAVESSHVFCATGCTMWSAQIQNAASAGYWMIFDATSAPADGAVTPTFCWHVAATTPTGWTWPTGARFRLGLVMVFSTGGDCVTKTASATAFFAGQFQP